MSNEKYGLNIDDNYVKILSNFLGFGNPETSKYWFIGNEEMLDSDKNEKEPKDKIINNKLNCSDGDIFRDENNGFFTKKFSNCQDMNNLWLGYEYIKNNFSELDNHFIG